MKLFIALLLLLVCAAAGYADAIENTAPFQAQRWIYWDFNQINWKEPVTFSGPAWDSPGWECDDIYIVGTDTDKLQWLPNYGAVGVINDTPTNIVLDLVFHVNNYEKLNPEKLIWDYASYYNLAFDLRVPDGFKILKSETKNVIISADNVVSDNLFAEVVPNPAWEEFVWHFDVAPGESAWLDSYSIWTACVPEPTTMIILIAGIAGIALRRRK